MIETLTNILNAIMAALRGLSMIGSVIPVSNVPKNDDTPSTPSTPSNPSPSPQTPSAPPEPPKPTPQGHKITLPEQIGANFYSKGSSAWSSQPGGQHFGTDFIANQGSPVYAPFDGIVIKIGHYNDAGKFGDYVMLTLKDGVEYYSGHLQDVKVRQGQQVSAGDELGETNNLNHTHIQIRINGQLRDFEEYRRNK